MAWLEDDCRMFVGSGFMVPGNTVGKILTEQTANATDKAAQQATDDKEKIASITILKVIKSKNSNTRAICQVGNGPNEQIVIAKNSVGETLLAGVGKEFMIKYNLMSDGKAWFAISAKPA